MKFGVIGCGKMGSAIISGICQKNLLNKSDIFCFDVNNSVIDQLCKNAFGRLNSCSDAFSSCDVVLLAVKPQELNSLIASLKGPINCSLIISIMAGVKIAKIEQIKPNVSVCRVMPNTCATIGESATSLCYNDKVDDTQKEFCRLVFSAIGDYVEIDESLMDDVIPIGGSFTAYAYTFMKAFIDSSIKRGISEEVAKKLVIQSMIGSAKMVEEFNDITTLIKNVCSKGGTTIAGLEQLELNNFEKIIDDCAIACAERSKELGKM